MAASFGWGFLAASTLIVGGAVALRWSIGERTLGLVMAFGSGVLISAVAFELAQEAWDKEGGRSSVALGLFAGSVTCWSTAWAAATASTRAAARPKARRSRSSSEPSSTASRSRSCSA